MKTWLPVLSARPQASMERPRQGAWRLLGIGEPRDRAAFRNGLAIRSLHIRKNAWRMANKRHGLFRRKHAFNERQRMAVVRQVPKRSMAAREEQAVIGCLVDFRQLDAVGKRMCCRKVFFKMPRIVGLE